MVHKLKTNLVPIEHKIVKVLLEHDYYLSTKEVAEKAGISWNTALFHLNKLHEKGWIEREERGNRIYWSAYTL